MIFKDRITVTEAGVSRDAHGNPSYDWDNPVTVQSIPAHVDYRSTSVDASTGIEIQSQAVAYCKPFHFDPRTQRIDWRGRWWQPDGDDIVRSIGGRTHHVEILLRRVTG